MSQEGGGHISASTWAHLPCLEDPGPVKNARRDTQKSCRTPKLQQQSSKLSARPWRLHGPQHPPPPDPLRSRPSTRPWGPWSHRAVDLNTS